MGKRTDKVSASGYQQRKECRNDYSLLCLGVVTYAEILLNHLGKTPCAEAGHKHGRRKSYPFARRKLRESAGPGVIDYTGYSADGIAPHDEENHKRNAHHHYDSLKKIGPHLGEIPAEHQQKRGNGGDYYHTRGLVNIEHYLANAGKSLIDRRRIRYKKNKHYRCRKNPQSGRRISFLKELRHGLYLQTAGNVAGAARQQLPREIRPEHGVSQSGEYSPQREAPAGRPCIADEHYRRKIRRTVGQRRKPRSGVSASDREVGHAFGLSERIDGDSRHHEYIQAYCYDNHGFF